MYINIHKIYYCISYVNIYIYNVLQIIIIHINIWYTIYSKYSMFSIYCKDAHKRPQNTKFDVSLCYVKIYNTKSFACKQTHFVNSFSSFSYLHWCIMWSWFTKFPRPLRMTISASWTGSPETVDHNNQTRGDGVLPNKCHRTPNYFLNKLFSCLASRNAGLCILHCLGVMHLIGLQFRCACVECHLTYHNINTKHKIFLLN